MWISFSHILYILCSVCSEVDTNAHAPYYYIYHYSDILGFSLSQLDLVTVSCAQALISSAVYHSALTYIYLIVSVVRVSGVYALTLYHILLCILRV